MNGVKCRWRLAAAGLLVSGVVTTGRAIEQMPPEYTARIFHVSPQDGDAPAKAAALVRGLKAQFGGRLPRGGVIVEFADGVYPLSETWTLGEADSGTPECPVRYRAQHPGKAVLTGALALDWRPLAAARGLPPSAARLPPASRDKVLTAELPAGEPLPSFFAASRYLQDEQLARPDYEYALALYQGDCRVENARWPNAGWARVTRLTGDVERSWIYENSKSLPFESAGPDGRPPDLAAWAKEPDIYLHGAWKHEYVDTASKPETVDPAAGLLAPAKADAQYGMRLGAEYFAFNAVCELDRPGEWALDAASRRLYVWPRPGADLPRLACTKTLLRCRGVTDVTFEGFVFEAARGHAVNFADCRDVALEKSVVRHTTGWGVYVERGRGCRVEGCDLYDLGEGGVWLEGGSIDTLAPSRHACDNCRIHDYAVLAWNYNPGVRLFGCGNEATHNLVYNAPHQACFFYGAENRFAWNVVHDVCRHTDDAGAIYTYNTVNAWANRGNVVEYNAFHRMAPEHPRYCQLNAIYLDAFTSGTVVRGNIASESSLGVFSSGGQDNLIEGNVLIHARNASIRRWNLGLMGGKNVFKHKICIQNEDGTLRRMTNDSDRASYLMKPLYDKGDLYRMSFWSERFPNMLKPLEFENPVMGHCAQFCTIRNNVSVDSPGLVVVDPDLTRETTIAEDATMFLGDPGFVDFMGMDWELKPDSPARKTLGRGTRFGEMGLYASAKRITPPVKWGPDVTRPQPFNPNIGKGTWATLRKADADVGAFVGKAISNGVANVLVTGVTADQRPFTPATRACEALSAMESFAWDFADGSGRPFEEVKNAVVDLAIMYPKLRLVVAAGLSDGDRKSLEEGLARAPQKPKVVETLGALMPSVRVAKDGHTDFAIVSRRDAPPPDAFAASELSLHLKLATGIDFRVVDDSAGRRAHAFELGTDRAVEIIGPDVVRALREEESIYVVKDGVVAFAGGGRAGLCYAVYSFLERELGCRWFNQEDDPYVPRRESLDVAEGEYREMPRMPYRMLHCTLTVRHADSREMLFYFRNRLNQLDGNYGNVCDSLKGKLPVRIREISPGCHTLFLYLPPDPAGSRAPGYISDLTNGYFAAHPDWYSLSKDGKRVKNRQLCFSNREMREALTRRILERIEAKGGEGFFDCSAQDVPDEFCYCDGCQELVRRYGSRGAPLFDFLHELAPKVKASFPKALLHFLAYRKEQTQRPPVGMPPWPDNLAAVFAPIDNDFSKNFLHPNNADSYADLKGWCSLVKTWEWYYTFAYGARFAPTPGLKRTAEDIRLSVDAGILGGYVEHDVCTYQGVNFADAETWMLMQHYRDPDRDWRELRREFFDYAYGAAADDMIEYSDMLERRLEDLPTLLTWDGGFPVRFTREELEDLNRRFDGAELKVSGDPLVLQRVREARFGLDVRSVCRDWPDAEAAYARATNTLMAAVARRYTAPKTGAQYARQFSAGALEQLKTRLFLATVTVKPLPAEFAGIDQSRIVQVFPQARRNYTESVDIAEAATGHAVREPLKPGKKRPSPYPAGFYDKASRTFVLNANIPESEWGRGEFRFHRIGRVPMPSANCIAWLGTSWAMSFSAEECYRPGSDDRWDVWASLRFDDDGAVLCDRVVFVKCEPQ